MTTPMSPRTYKPAGNVLNHSYAVMLRDHPEAFDCIIYPARSSEHNEILADNAPVGTLLDRDERAQQYDQPVQGRAMIVPTSDLAFDATDSGSYESFHSASEAINLLLSEPGLRKHTLVQWLEYRSLESEETVERTVYIADIQPMGRTLGAGMLYVCHPLPALGEIPDAEVDLGPEVTPGENEGMPGTEPDTPQVGVL